MANGTKGKRKEHGGLTIRKRAVQKGRAERWWLEGTIGGERIRQSFRSRDKAQSAKLDYEVKHAREESAMRMLPTSLPEEKLREAEEVLHRLPNGITLTSVFEFWKQRFNPDAEQKPLKEAVTEFQATQRAEDMNATHYRTSKAILEKLVQAYPDATLATLTAEDIERFIDSRDVSKKTHDNYRGVIGKFLRWCHEQKRWLKENPIIRVRRYGKRNYGMGIPEILTPEQARQVMQYVDDYEGGIWAPWFALALFAGIRPSFFDGELRKLHEAGWENFVNLKAGTITLTREVTKNRRMRKIKIQPNLKKWLLKYPPKSTPLLKGSQWKYSDIKRRFGIGHDVLRHSFISYLVGQDRSLGDAALQAGNSESMIHDHYLDVVTPEAAKEFWQIEPRPRDDAAKLLKFG